MGLGPFDWYGADFLALYIGLLVLTGIISILLPHWTRPEGRPGRVEDLDLLAYLAKGTPRMAESAAARLLARGELKLEGKSSLRSIPAEAGSIRPDGTRIERAILGLARPGSWAMIQRELADYGAAMRSQLAQKGLLMDPATSLRARLRHSLPLLALLLFGLTKYLIGEARGRPTEFLLALLIVTAVLAVLRFGALDQRTVAGHALLSEEGARADRLRRAPMAAEVGLAVALFGTVVLAGSPWAAFHTMRRESGDSGCGGDSSSGGGCGGGGCGGCGG